MPIIFQKLITRDDLRKNPDVFYLFGDNEKRGGYGGQAREMRGEVNALGIRTKAAPNSATSAYWSDDNLTANIKCIQEDFIPIKRYLEQNRIIVIPLDGLGTGLAELPLRAPETFKYIEFIIAKLCTVYNKVEDRVG